MPWNRARRPVGRVDEQRGDGTALVSGTDECSGPRFHAAPCMARPDH